MPLSDHSNRSLTNPLAGSIAYEYDHYSGSQISLMFGDVLVDNAIHVQFNVNQNRSPVYGYANNYYAFTAGGKVLVQGSLTIAFKEAGYLFWPIKRFHNRKLDSKFLGDTWTSPRYGVTKNGVITRGYDTSKADNTFTTAAKEAERKRIMRANIEQMAKWENQKPQRAGSPYNSFVKQLGALSDNRFEDWAEVFEDAIWYGSDPENAELRDMLFSKNILDDQLLDDEAVLSHRRADQYPPIDIWIAYGDINNQAANHTVKKLLDVSFVGQAQTIEVSGEPVFESYSFIAKNLV